MSQAEDQFWDRRYLAEGAIWGEGPSPTALLAARYLRAGDRVFEVGFGYGRDLAFLGQRRCLVSGIDLSPTGLTLARQRLEQAGVQPQFLYQGRFEDAELAPQAFDMVLCHRMAHLLITPEAIRRFARKVEEVLRPGGLLCLAARNTRDLNLAEMVPVADQVYEYIRRPGHRIRYWDDAAFHEAFGEAFALRRLTAAVEQETAAQPVPCHLTILVAHKTGAPLPSEQYRGKIDSRARNVLRRSIRIAT
jgi:SAM-dependent methyltransferase